MTIILGLCMAVATVIVMELVAFLAHKYVMHGFLWSWHQSHHAPRLGRFERNDRFALVFAALSIGLIYLGRYNYGITFWIGWGMAGYGLIYLVFHDGLVHGRLPVPRWLRRNGYLKHLMQAHRLHHATHGRDDAVSYGFLYAPPLDKLKAGFKRDVAKAQARLTRAVAQADAAPTASHNPR